MIALKWLKEQKKQKGFQIWAVVTLLLISALAVEFHILGYGILKALRYLILLCGTGIIGWIDAKEHRIPNKMIAALLVIRTILLAAEILAYPGYGLSLIISAVGGFAFGGVMFGLCYLISRGGMGAGDVKLMAAVGYFMGMGGIFTVSFLSILCTGLCSVVLLIFKKIGMKDEMPFAPYVFLGMIITMGLGV